MMEKFRHEALSATDQIRLLRVLPPDRSKGGKDRKDDTDQVHCELVTCKLGDKPFNALSYVWGSTTNPQTLVCDGKTMEMTYNLDSALRGIRRRRRWRKHLLWVDAVCINQSDDDEKTVQIRLMERIYREAMHTVIWLEIDSRNIERFFLGINSLNLLAKAFDGWYFSGFNRMLGRKFKHWPDLSKPLGSIYRILLENVFAVGDAPLALQNLRSSAWFQRVWTVQEVLLNKDPVILSRRWDLTSAWSLPYVHRLLPLPTARVEEVSFRNSLSDFQSRDRIQHWDSFRKVDLTSTSQLREHFCLMLLVVVKSSLASDPKDKIMGALALLEHVNLMRPELGYTMSVQDLYATFTMHLIYHYKSLAILALAAFNGVTPDMPSWAVDWNNPMARDWMLERSLYLRPQGWCQNSRFSSATRLSPFSETSQGLGGSGRRLLLRGMMVSIVSRSSRCPCPSYEVITASWELQAIATWISFLGALDPGDTTRDLAGELTELVTMVEQHNGEPWSWDVGRKQLRALLDMGTHDPNDPIFYALAMHPDLYDTLESCPYQSLFVTDKGALGLCFCRYLEDGDVIAVVAGSDLPIILRPTPLPDKEYTYVGPAVVRGMMLGEYWPDEVEVESLPVLPLV